MDFIREITYEVVPQGSNPHNEVYNRATIYTLLEVPEAHKKLLAQYNDCHVNIIQYRRLPYLK